MRSKANRSALAAGCLFLAAAAVVIWLSWIDRPDPPDGELDPSWQAVLAHAHAAELTFGREIIFTHGPWGWLTSHFLLEEAYGGKRMWEVVGKLLFAAGAVLLSLRLPVLRRVLFLALLPTVGLFFPDTHMVALLCLAVLLGLMAENTPRAAVVAILIAIGLLSTMKFVYAIVGMSGVGLTVAGRFLQRRWFEGAALAMGAAASFLLAWFASGQPFPHLVDHLRMSLELSGGYGGAMSVDEPLSVFLMGAGAALVLVASCGLAMRDTPARSMSWPAAIYLAFVTFVMWKHGFTRADGHVFAFFNHAVLLGICAAPALQWRRPWDPFLLSSAAGVAGMFLWDASLASHAPVFLADHVRSGFNYVTHPKAAREIFQEALRARRAGEAMPGVVETVGNASIDALGHHQGALLLNDMNYRGRPVFQSYAAYTPTLLRRNLRFLQRDRAPDFLLWRHGTIDGRFPSLDDSLLIAEIPRRYEPLQSTTEGLLLRRRAIQPGSTHPAHEELEARHLAWGEPLRLPDRPEHALWLEIQFGTSFVGKLRGALYKPGAIQMVVTEQNGRETRHRLIPGIAKVGFLVHPFLEAQEDIDLFAEGQAGKAIQSVRFEPAHADERELWTGVHARVFRLPEISVRLISPYQHYVRLGVMSDAPESVTSGVGVHLIHDEANPALLVHPPGEMTFAIGAERRCLSGSFGIRADAYQGSGATDGVSFSILAEDVSGHRALVWTRTLRPLSEPADRGLQSFRACAPEGTERIILSTGAGDNNNTDWDWAYWAGIRIEDQARDR